MAKPWSKDEVRLLKRLFPSGRTRQVVAKIGRPLTAVRQKAYDMGLKSEVYHFWSTDDLKLLRKLFPNTRTEEIADKLGRSLHTVKNKAYQLGLKKTKKYLETRRQK